jgi:hypothetical protein
MSYNHRPVKEYADLMISARKVDVLQGEVSTLRGKIILAQDDRLGFFGPRLRGDAVDKALDELDRYLQIIAMTECGDVEGLITCVYDEVCGHGNSNEYYLIRGEYFDHAWTLKASCKGIAETDDTDLSHLLAMVKRDASGYTTCMYNPGIYGLGQSSNPKAVEVLYESVFQVPMPRRDRERFELQNILDALGNSRVFSASERLLDILDHRQGIGVDLRWILDALMIHGDDVVLRSLVREVQRAGFTPGAEGVAPADVLKEALRSEDIKVRRALYEAFRRVRNEWDCFPDFLPLLEQRFLGEEKDGECLVQLANCLCWDRFPPSLRYAESALESVPYPAKAVAIRTLLRHSHARAVELALQAVRNGAVPLESQAELVGDLLSYAKQKDAIPLAIEYLDRHSANRSLPMFRLHSVADALHYVTGQDFGSQSAYFDGNRAKMREAARAYGQWWENQKDTFKFPAPGGL